MSDTLSVLISHPSAEISASIIELFRNIIRVMPQVLKKHSTTIEKLIVAFINDKWCIDESSLLYIELAYCASDPCKKLTERYDLLI